jgi:hypothetical protein
MTGIQRKVTKTIYIFQAQELEMYENRILKASKHRQPTTLILEYKKTLPKVSSDIPLVAFLYLIYQQIKATTQS